MTELKIYRLRENAVIPTFATKGSACFDLYACIPEAGGIVKAYNFANKQIGLKSYKDRDGRDKLVIPGGTRALVPTGLSFDIPTGHSVRVHIRSGVSVKQGLTLINNEGIIDEDYVDEVYLTVFNGGNVGVVIEDGARVGQGELVETLVYDFTEIYNKPEPKTERTGGFGSTGI